MQPLSSRAAEECFRILIIDPDPRSREAVQKVLARQGRELVFAMGGTLALACVDSERPMDVALLATDGSDDSLRELARELLSRDPDTEIILLTALGSTDAADQASQIGAFTYQCQPFNDERQFMMLVRSAAEKARLKRSARKLSAQLCASDERFELAAQSSGDGLWHWELAADRTDFSPRWQEMMGLTGQVLSTSIEEWLSRVHRDDVDRVRSVVLGVREGRAVQFQDEHRVLHQDGSYRWVVVRGAASAGGSGRAVRLVGAQADVTSRRRAEQQESYNTYHDAVTFLPNRSLMLTLLDQLLAEPSRQAVGELVVVSIGVDRFKAISQALGDRVGDQLLHQLARRIENCLREGDAVARSGSAAFVVLLANTSDPTPPLQLVGHIQTELAKPLSLGGQDVVPSCSAGVAMGGPACTRAEDLLKDAEFAMQRAAALGRGRYVVYETNMREHSARLMDLDSALRQSIERQELRVFYQPIVSLTRGRISGFEALVRWQHPTRGFISPAVLIPLAEENGFIHPLGEFVLDEAVRQLCVWQSELSLAEPLTMSVNISAKQFSGTGLVAQVERVLRAYGLDPARLHLEITESSIMENLETAASVLQHLKSLAVQVHLDDFGTGYSSLAHLLGLGVDCLKIDRAFVSALGTSAKSTVIVEATTALARSLGIQVIAEGVETADQLRQLHHMDCGFAQGFLFSKPLPAAEMAALLARGPSW